MLQFPHTNELQKLLVSGFAEFSGFREPGEKDNVIIKRQSQINFSAPS